MLFCLLFLSLLPWISFSQPLLQWSGVRLNVPISSFNGWQQCYLNSYAAGGPVSVALSTCGKPLLLILCRKNGNETALVAAQGDRASILQDSGTGTNTATQHNGVAWYFSGVHSWGFNTGGNAVDRTPCSSQNGADRLCWPTVSGNFATSGSRCGDAKGLSSPATNEFERMIFQADIPTFPPSLSPSTSQPTKNPTTSKPTKNPSRSPSDSPTTSTPTKNPSRSPSDSPTTSTPTRSPTKSPTSSKPTKAPTFSTPTRSPSKSPTISPTKSPTSSIPTVSPTFSKPTRSPTVSPTNSPSFSPTQVALISFQNPLSVSTIVGTPSLHSFQFQTQYPVNVTLQVCTPITDSWLTISGDSFLTVTEAFTTQEFTFQLNVSQSTKDHFQGPDAISRCLKLEAFRNELKVFSTTVSLPISLIQRCLPGSSSPNALNAPQICTECVLGTYSSSDQTFCEECPDNFPRTIGTGKTSLDDCVQCPLGYSCPVDSEPQTCPANGGYEPLGAQENDREEEFCVAVPCEETFWCGPGAAENSTYVKTLQLSPVETSVIIRQKKSLTIPIENLADYPIGIFVNDAEWIEIVAEEGEYVLAPNSVSNVPIIIDSAFFTGDRVNTTIPLLWHDVEDTDYFFDIHVPLTISIITIIVSPTTFDYHTTNNSNHLFPEVVTEIEVFNTLCNNSISVTVPDRDCDGKPLPNWFSLTDAQPFDVKLIEAQSGLPLVLNFGLNATQLSVEPFPKNVSLGIPQAKKFDLCFNIELDLNGLELTITRDINITFSKYRLCPPGTFSLTGDDGQGCSPCTFNSYQPLEGKTFCERCPDAFPRTAETGTSSLSLCLADAGGYKNANGTRESCPKGADCSGIGSTLRTLKIYEGYWRTNPDSVDVLSCPNAKYCAGGKMLENDEEYSEFANETRARRGLSSTSESIFSDRLCLSNHTGHYCYACVEGAVKRTANKICTFCTPEDLEEDRLRIFGVFFSLSLAFLFVIFSVFYTTHRAYQISTGISKRRVYESRMLSLYEALDFSIPIQITISFVQVISGMSVTFRSILPAFFLELKNVFSTLALDFVNILDFGCTLPAQNHLSSLLISTLLPIGVILFLFGTHFILEHTLARNNSKLRNEMKITTFTVFLMILFLVYPSCSNRILATFACSPFDDGTYALTIDPSIDCNSEQYYPFSIYAGFMVLVYPIGIPLFYSILLYRERRQLNPFSKNENLNRVAEAMRENNNGVRYLRFLWKPYKPRYFWFETFELLRKLVQTSIVVFVAPGSSPQIVFQLLATVISIVVLNSLVPYVERAYNILALIAQWAIFGIALITLLIKYNLATNGTDYNQSALDNLMVAAFFIVPACGIFIILLGAMRNYREIIFWINWDHWFGQVSKKTNEISKNIVDKKNKFVRASIATFDGQTMESKNEGARLTQEELFSNLEKLLTGDDKGKELLNRLKENSDTIENQFQIEKTKGETLLMEREQLQERNRELEIQLENHASSSSVVFKQESFSVNSRTGNFEVNNQNLKKVEGI